MNTTLTITGVETKTSKAGRLYKSFKTTQGNMTCFESSVVTLLESNMNKQIEVDVSERNGFKNIVSMVGQGIQVELERPVSPIVEARSLKDQSIYTSYVKDLIVAGKTIDDAIAIIRQAKEAFS